MEKAQDEGVVSSTKDIGRVFLTPGEWEKVHSSSGHLFVCPARCHCSDRVPTCLALGRGDTSLRGG